MLDWKQLVWLSNEQLAVYDIAEVNLACAAGLPGSEAMDAALCLSRLDSLARYVKIYTEECLPDFFRNPGHYINSLAYYRIMAMITALVKGCGIRYNPAKMPPDAPFYLADSFVFGALQGPGGTCATLPVVFAAVGRRLGYPIKLVSAMSCKEKVGHGFSRWDGDGERFNIEGSQMGFASHPDEYYRTGRYQVSPRQIQGWCLLRSMTPREELATFLTARGLEWKTAGNLREAANCFAWALSLQPDNRIIHCSLVATCDMWEEKLVAIRPPGFPDMYFRWPLRRFPASVPLFCEREGILALEGIENLLNDPLLERQFWGPQRRKEFVSRLPTKAFGSWVGDTCQFRIEYSTIMAR